MDWKKRVVALGLCLCGLFASLLIVEGLFRWVRPDLIPSNQLKSEADPDIGWKFVPHQRISGRSEEGIWRTVSTNGEGFRDRDHPLDKPPGTTRIAILGDSFTAAVGVDDHQTFCALTESQFTSKGHAVEVMNFGVPGFGTANEYLTWLHRVKKYHPDKVILAFFTGNDVTNQLPDYPVGTEVRPQFVWVDGKISLQPFQITQMQVEDPHQGRSWLYKKFLVPSVLYQQYKLFERDLRRKFHLTKSAKKSTVEEAKPFWKRSYAPVDWQTYLRNPDPDVMNAWRLTEGLLKALDQDVRSTGASFQVLLIPSVEVMEPSLLKKAAGQYPEIANLDFDVDFPCEKLMEFGSQENIPMIDLKPEFELFLQGNPGAALYFKYDPHFASKGHQWTADILVSKINFTIH